MIFLNIFYTIILFHCLSLCARIDAEQTIYMELVPNNKAIPELPLGAFYQVELFAQNTINEAKKTNKSLESASRLAVAMTKCKGQFARLQFRGPANIENGKKFIARITAAYRNNRGQVRAIQQRNLHTTQNLTEDKWPFMRPLNFDNGIEANPFVRTSLMHSARANSYKRLDRAYFPTHCANVYLNLLNLEGHVHYKFQCNSRKKIKILKEGQTSIDGTVIKEFGLDLGKDCIGNEYIIFITSSMNERENLKSNGREVHVKCPNPEFEDFNNYYEINYDWKADEPKCEMLHLIENGRRLWEWEQRKQPVEPQLPGEIALEEIDSVAEASLAAAAQDENVHKKQLSAKKKKEQALLNLALAAAQQNTIEHNKPFMNNDIAIKGEHFQQQRFSNKQQNSIIGQGMMQSLPISNKAEPGGDLGQRRHYNVGQLQQRHHQTDTSLLPVQANMDKGKGKMPSSSSHYLLNPNIYLPSSPLNEKHWDYSVAAFPPSPRQKIVKEENQEQQHFAIPLSPRQTAAEHPTAAVRPYVGSPLSPAKRKDAVPLTGQGQQPQQQPERPTKVLRQWSSFNDRRKGQQQQQQQQPNSLMLRRQLSVQNLATQQQLLQPQQHPNIHAPAESFSPVASPKQKQIIMEEMGDSDGEIKKLLLFEDDQSPAAAAAAAAAGGGQQSAADPQSKTTPIDFEAQSSAKQISFASVIKSLEEVTNLLLTNMRKFDSEREAKKTLKYEELDKFSWNTALYVRKKLKESLEKETSKIGESSGGNSSAQQNAGQFSASESRQQALHEPAAPIRQFQQQERQQQQQPIEVPSATATLGEQQNISAAAVQAKMKGIAEEDDDLEKQGKQEEHQTAKSKGNEWWDPVNEHLILSAENKTIQTPGADREENNEKEDATGTKWVPRSADKSESGGASQEAQRSMKDQI